MKNIKIKVLFLDIDGVLNHELHYEEKSQGGRGEETDYILADISLKSLDLLSDFVKETGVKVVISSTWRMSEKRMDVLKNLFFERGIEIIDCTPVLNFKNNVCLSIPRGCEIDFWLHIYGTNRVDNYIIFDDDSDMLLNQRENFFLVDGYCGITPNLLHRAKRFLMK